MTTIEINGHVFYGNFDKVKQLVEQGVSVNSKDDSGRTPLHFAVREGRFDMVQYLVEKGADVNMPDITGCTPLISARFTLYRKSETKKIVKYLIDSGADITLRDDDGLSAIDFFEKHKESREEVWEYLSAL